MRIGKLGSAGLAVLLAVGGSAWAQSGATKTAAAKGGNQELQVYFVDVEGGQSTLFVMPTGESLLVDTGSPDPRSSTAPGTHGSSQRSNCQSPRIQRCRRLTSAL